MNAYRALALTVPIPMLLLVGCGSDPSTVTKPRTEAECAGLEARSAAWLEGMPEYDEEDLEAVRRNNCKKAFAYVKGSKLQIEATKCIFDLRKGTLTIKDKQALIGMIESTEQHIKEYKKYTSQISTCPELGG